MNGSAACATTMFLAKGVGGQQNVQSLFTKYLCPVQTSSAPDCPQWTLEQGRQDWEKYPQFVFFSPLEGDVFHER